MYRTPTKASFRHENMHGWLGGWSTHLFWSKQTQAFLVVVVCVGVHFNADGLKILNRKNTLR